MAMIRKMEYQEEPSSTNQNPKVKEAAVCEECGENRSKYKCPGCSIRTCGLACIKAHKQRTGCSGKRNVTQFVPLSQFNDSTLLSDYNLLEEMKRVSESAHRLQSKLCGYAYFKLPYYLRRLRSAAASRRTKILFLPSGMTKREKNQTQYDQRRKFISWTIEWRFHSTDVILLDHGVPEDRNLCSIIENHLKPGPWSHQLRQFCEQQLDHLKFFICKNPKDRRSPFWELDVKAPIRQQLYNIVILEYPVINVFLPSHSYEFEVVKDSPFPHKCLFKDHVNQDHQSPKLVPFREEEIEEDNSASDPTVVDLMKNVNSSLIPQMPNEDGSGKLSNNLDRHLLIKVAAGNSAHSIRKTEKGGVFEDMEFDFDQGLIDAYSNIIAEIDPDDFLDLEGIFAQEPCVEGGEGFSRSGEDYFGKDELEEGEIAE